MRSDMVRAMTERWESRMFPSRKNVDFRRVNSTGWMENWREKWKISSMRIIIPSGWILKNLKLYIVENGFLASGYIGLQYSQLLLKTISRLAAVGVFRMKKGKKKKRWASYLLTAWGFLSLKLEVAIIHPWLNWKEGTWNKGSRWMNERWTRGALFI